MSMGGNEYGRKGGGIRVGKFLPERKKPVAKTGNNRHGKNLVAKMAKTGKNYL